MEAECDAVSFVEPRTTGPTPDLVTVPAGRQLFVECTAVNDSADDEKAYDVFAAIIRERFDARAARGTVVSFADDVDAADAHRRLPEILRAMADVCETGSELDLAGLAVIRPLEEVDGDSVIRGQLRVGDSYRTIDRLLRRVRRKAGHGQLRRMGPSIVAVRSRALWSQHTDQFEALSRLLREEITQALVDADHVGGVLLVEEWFVDHGHVAASGDLAVGRLEVRGGTARATLLALNPSAAVPLSDAELRFLRGACQRW
jgi:hypothetical protein